MASWCSSLILTSFSVLVLSSSHVMSNSDNGVSSGDSTTEKEEFPAGHLKMLGEHRRPETDGVTVLDYIPSGKDFYSNFVKKRRPLLMRGAARHWKAVQNWWNETYLRESYGSVLMDVEMGKTHDGVDLNVRKTMNMSEFLDTYKTQNVYLDSPFPQSEMIDDLEVPFCMQCLELSSTLSSAHLLFSSGNTSSSLHQDGYENMFALISGRKVFTIFNYTYGKELYAMNSTTFPGLSPICAEKVDLVKYPDFAKVPFYQVELKAGDLFYNPLNWWHHVRSFDSPNIAVSIWFYMFKGNDETMPDTTQVLEMEDYSANLIARASDTIRCIEQNMPMNIALQHSKSKITSAIEPEKVPMVTLASGHMMPMIGFGSGGNTKEFTEQTEEIVLEALMSGYKMIDTSPVYNETAVGEAWVRSFFERRRLFITSKVYPKKYGFSKTVQSVADSLENLRTKYLDLVLLNGRNCTTEYAGSFACDDDGYDADERETWQNAWRALEYLVKIGKVRAVGVSNFDLLTLKELKEFSEVPISVVQNWFDLFNNDSEVRQWCKENNVTYMGFSTLGGIWEAELGLNPVLSQPRAQEIADELNVDVANVIIRWAVGKGVAVIPRSQNPKHMKANIHQNDFRLTEEEIHDLDSLAGTYNDDNLKPVHSKRASWDGTETNTAESGDSTDEESGFVYQNIVQSPVDPGEATVFISSDDHWIYALDATFGNEKWRTLTGDETGSSCAFSLNGLSVYCGADDTYIRALSIINGTVIWKFKTNASVTSSAHVGKDGTLYIGSHDNYLYALTEYGKLKWKTNLNGKVWGSPVTSMEGDLVYISSFIDITDNIFALYTETGSVAWSYRAGAPVVSSPRVSHDGNTLSIGDNHGKVYYLNARTGDKIWSKQLTSMILSTPMISSRFKVFVGCHDGDLVALDAKNGKKLWTRQLSKETTSSPVLGEGDVLYIGAGNGTVYALKQSDGTTLWSTDTGSQIYFSSARLSSSGVLYIGSVGGPLFALNSTDGKLVWKAITSGPVVGTPLITEKYAVWYT